MALVLASGWAINAPASAAAPINATLALSKTATENGTNTPLSGPVTPGESFDYQLAAACSGLTEGCISAKTVDVLPPGIVFNGADTSPLYRVTYDAATRTVTVVYTSVLQPPNPPGSTGIPAGSTRVAVLHVALDPNTTAPDGSDITNRATTTADNANPVTDTEPITVSVPRRVTPVATKSMMPSSLIAKSGANTTVTLGVSNGSSATAEVKTLSVGDTSVNTWDDFNLTSVGPVTEFPAGADQVDAQYCTGPAPCTAAQFVSTGFVAGPDLTLPGVDLATVTGIQFVFRNAAGATLPVSTTPGAVPIGLTLRDTVRSTGAVLDPTRPLSQRNCASPAASEEVAGAVTGADKCVTFTVQPGSASVSLGKQFFPDASGSFGSNGYAVAGQNSGVTALSKASNASAFPVTNLTITDPSGTTPSDFGDVDVSNIRLFFPAGATSAAVAVTCGDGSTRNIAATPADTNPALGCPAASPAKRISVTYSGASIPAGAVAQLGVHGTLTNSAAGGTTITDCSDAVITAGAQGSATSTGCAPLPVETPRATVNGVKSSSSPSTGGELVPGLPMSFTISATNSGNLPQSAFTITDPDPGAAGPNPFTVVRLTSATVTTTPTALAGSFVIEVLDGGTWVAYDASDAALLTRATGVRARLLTGRFVQPTNRVSLVLQTQVRDGVAPGATLTNCQRTTVTTSVTSANSGDVCAPQLTVELPRSGGQVTKFVAPGSIPAPLPGVTSVAQVQLRASNNGNTPMSRIVIIDPDPKQDDPDEFWNRVNLVSLGAVNFPPGANRVQVDTCISEPECDAGNYTTGAPATTATLPIGVTASEVSGLRFTFTNSQGGFALVPGTNFPTASSCPSATACFTVTPRTTTRLTGAPIAFPTSFSDVATAAGETTISGGLLTSFGSAPAPLTVSTGQVQLSPVKSAEPVRVTPGSAITYSLATTNTGTAAVPALRIVEPIPAGLVFDSSFAGDGGFPYTLTATVPAGATAPPRPQFTQTTDPATNKVTELVWQFPEAYEFLPTSKITLSFEATLTPGTTAGTSVNNTFGATTTDTNTLSGLACKSGPVDPALGCTASAAVIAGSGSAVDAQKWVHGDDSRGFYNSQTKTFVAIGDPACPILTVDGLNYTRFPCIALVQAGQNFNFLLNLTNVGTTTMTDTRLVDDLPKIGDRGVIVPSPRGTEWDPRPGLAGAPSIASGFPGQLTLGYANASPGCIADLAHQPAAGCPASSWDDPLSAQVQAFRAYLHFATPLAPAATTRIVVPMIAPADLDTTTNQLPIAWNSFAHTDFFQLPDGSSTQLKVVEPIQVGVGMPFGNLQIVKQITGNIPPNSDIGPFRGTYQCVVTTAAGVDVTVARGTGVFNADSPFTVTHVPAGAVCTVTETDTGGGNVTQPAPVTILEDVDPDLPSPTVVTVTNDFPAPRLIVTKMIDGAAGSYAVGPFKVDVTCTALNGAVSTYHLTFDVAGSQSITSVPIGASCTAAEPDRRGATSTTISYSNGDHADITALVDGVATITNTYDPATLTVSKSVVGPGRAGPYTFTATCTLDSGAIVVPLAKADALFTLSRGGHRTIDVPTGAACVVRERNVPSGDVVTYDGHAAVPTLDVNGPTAVAVTNTFRPLSGEGSSTPGSTTPPGSGTTSATSSAAGLNSSSVDGGGSGLSSTGSDLRAPTLFGLALVLGGFVLWFVGRRRGRIGRH